MMGGIGLASFLNRVTAFQPTMLFLLFYFLFAGNIALCIILLCGIISTNKIDLPVRWVLRSWLAYLIVGIHCDNVMNKTNHILTFTQSGRTPKCFFEQVESILHRELELERKIYDNEDDENEYLSYDEAEEELRYYREKEKERMQGMKITCVKYVTPDGVLLEEERISEESLV
jgi:hypothetical protein